jgi:L-malate glycosyltransferase
MTDLRVLHVLDSLLPGGTERQCLELACGLSSIGVHNTVFCFRTGPLLAELERSGIDVQQMPMGSFRSRHFPYRLIRLAQAVRRWRPYVVQTYGFYSDVPGLVAGVLAGVRARVAGRRDLGAHLRPAQRRADRWAWRLAHRVVVNSDAVRQQLVHLEHVAPEKVVVIRNGLNLHVWQPRDESIDTADAVVGMVAHFREQKDHMTFLRAAKEILTTTSSVRFCLIGSGALEETVRERASQLGIASHVEFLGALEGDALRVAVRRFRVSVLTSKNNEGMPNAVLEAMAAGLPVVATAVGGATEIIEDGVTGFLVPPETPPALADRVIRLLKDPSLAEHMGKRGRDRVAREFPIQRMVDQFYGLYRELLPEDGLEPIARARVARR